MSGGKRRPPNVVAPPADQEQPADAQAPEPAGKTTGKVRPHDKALSRLDKRLRALERAMNDLGRLDGTVAGLDQTVKGFRNNQKSLARELGKLVARMAKVGGVFDPSVDERFVDVVQPLVDAKQTMLGHERLFTLWQAAGNVGRLPFPAVEVGTFRGGSAALLALAFRALSGADRELHVVDTFEGHLDETLSDYDDADRQRGKFQDASFEGVQQFLASVSPQVHVYKGDAVAVIGAWPERQYSLVHIDVDLYQPMIECLDYFGPRLAEGGVIIVDDYETPTCPGVAQAVHEYVARSPGFQLWRMQAEQVVLIKR